MHYKHAFGQASQVRLDNAVPNVLAGLMDYLQSELGIRHSATAPLIQVTSMPHFEQQFQEAIRRLAEMAAERGELTGVFHRAGILLCRVLVTCNTLEEAIQNTMDFYTMVTPEADECGFKRQGNNAIFICSRMPKLRHSKASALVLAIGVLYFIQLFSWLIGEPLKPRRVMLTHALSDKAAPILQLFNAPVESGVGYYGFEFDAVLLSHPIVRRSEDLPMFLEGYPCRLFSPIPVAPPLHQQIRLYLDAALAHRDPLPNATAMASMLGFSEATLRRRLRSDGIGYDSLKDQTMRDSALRYLNDTGLSVDQISERLGFSDSKSFRRAFHRWMGCAPTQIRKSHRSALLV